MFSSFSNRIRSNRFSAVAEESSIPARPQNAYSSTRPYRAHDRPRYYSNRHIVHEIYVDDDDSEGDDDGDIVIVMRRAEPDVPVYYYAWLPYLRGVLLILSCGLFAMDMYTLSVVEGGTDAVIRRVVLDFTTGFYVLYSFFGTIPIHHHWRRGLLCLLASLWWINTLVIVSSYSGRCENRSAVMCVVDYLATALSFVVSILIVIEMHSTYREYMLNKLIRKSALEGSSDGGNGYELSQRRMERVSGSAGAGGPDVYAYDRRYHTMRSLSRTSSMATLPVYESEPSTRATFYPPPGVLPAPTPQPTPPPNFDEAVRSGQITSSAHGRVGPQTTPLPSPPAYPAVPLTRDTPTEALRSQQ